VYNKAGHSYTPQWTVIAIGLISENGLEIPIFGGECSAVYIAMLKAAYLPIAVKQTSGRKRDLN